MLSCPFCDAELRTGTTDGWTCSCGESIPYGMEKDEEENCANCKVRDCPRRR